MRGISAMRVRVWLFMVALTIALTGSAAGQIPSSCEDEVRSLRWLVQKYSADRAQLEFALATSEARRQAVEAELARLKSAPAGQNPAPK